MIVWDLVYSLAEPDFQISLIKVSCEFRLRRMSILHWFQMAIFLYCSGLQWHGRCMYCTCWCDLDLIQRSWSLTSSIFANCILAWSSKLMVDYDSMSLVYSYSKPNFWISPPVGGHMTSKFVKCWYHRNPLGFVSALAAARSLWLWLQVCRNKPYTLMTISPLVGLFYGRPLALCNRAEHYIFALWFLSSIYLSSFFPRLISAATDWMSTILLHMAWP